MSAPPFAPSTHQPVSGTTVAAGAADVSITGTTDAAGAADASTSYYSEARYAGSVSRRAMNYLVITRS